MMKKRLTYLLYLVLIIVGLSVMLYPAINKNQSLKKHANEVSDYTDAAQKLSRSDYKMMLSEAQMYNIQLQKVKFPYQNYDVVEGYEDILDVSGTGMMGHVLIDKIHVGLPIYHGTSEANLQAGVGHLQGSSLPVGGVGTHAVLSAHSGVPGAELFSQLNKLEIGDRFKISVLNNTLIYEVDQIKVVSPEEIDDLYIDPEQDYCTLMTCTPPGINTHRLLV